MLQNPEGIFGDIMDYKLVYNVECLTDLEQ